MFTVTEYTGLQIMCPFIIADGILVVYGVVYVFV